jgi:hypothetical protein
MLATSKAADQEVSCTDPSPLVRVPWLVTQKVNNVGTWSQTIIVALTERTAISDLEENRLYWLILE